MKKKAFLKLKFHILKQRLKTFGLNPKEWQILELPNGILVVQNIFENELTLLGRATVKKMGWEWKEIQFAEI